MIFEVECDKRTNEGLTDRTHTRIVSFIVLDIFVALQQHQLNWELGLDNITWE